MSLLRPTDRVLLFVLCVVASAEFLLNIDRHYSTGIFTGSHSLNIDAPDWLDAI